MPATAFVEKLHDQIANEFAASQQYVAIAVHYDAQTLPRLAAFFYRQSLEERNHAMMMVGYLIDAGLETTVPGVDAPTNSFADIVEPVKLALDQEREVSDRITELAKIARDEGDYSSEQFMQWFLKEQVEEVASMSALLRVVERAREDPMRAEDYLAREAVGDGGEPAGDPTAPPAAGGAL
jgi:ferritin